MNKQAFPISIIAILMSTVMFFYFKSKTSELVFVDVNKLIEGYKRTKVEREKFDEKAQLLKANVDSLMVDWQKELKNYEKTHSSMTKKELVLKQEVLRNKQEQIGNYKQVIQKQIQEEDQKVTQTVINDINDYVKEFGEKKGYDVIFGASGNGNIMYAKDASDLTKIILIELNKSYEGTK
ncbi:MAG: OmpH family outer membrane protein [Cellulophaga sp.]